MKAISNLILVLTACLFNTTIYAQLNLIHQNGFGGTYEDHPVSFTPSKKLLIIDSYSSATGNKGLPTYGSSDIWMLKLDEQLNKVSEFVYGGNSIEDPVGLVTIGNSHYLLASSCSSISGNKTVADYGVGVDCGDFWLIKLNSQNVITSQWAFGTSKSESPRGMLSHNNSLILFGNSAGGIELDKSESNRGYGDGWIICVDTNGAKIWDKTFGHTGNDIFIKALVLNDGYLFAGHSNSNTGNDKSEDCFGQNDIWVVKTDYNGIKIWDKTLGSAVYEQLYDVLYHNNEIIIIGSTDDATGSGNLGIIAENNNTDGFIAKLNNTNGNLISVQSFDNSIKSIYPIPNGKFIFTSYESENNDIIVGWMDSNFTIKEEIILSTSAIDYPIEISYLNNNIYLLATTQGGISGDKTSPNYGLEDTWILAFDITLSNNELSLMPDFKIYPNPTTDFIKINLPNDQYNQVQIVDMQGRVIAEMPVSNHFEQTIDVSNYKTGTYFIKAKLQNGISVSKKFVKF